ncbi:MAG: hypothetical protein ABS13_06075 [SAR86 cluster bacterium BACL1 MAG-121128-bin56]|jgi:hypothetical protein|nr:MAG: hypothetical protein ABS12_03630 [SAR86 cluster bacterium BACL1 MAG-121004-bin11]KRP16062.1 MAG: hypothetical protein ABS13_06075 [SAR86 cluster bacterium BACL1 MAG-121128-bin56]MDP5038239.1 hypothetical protein [SAR86 cluster bacterium]|tara:strand:- start:150 stop:755 length:606 start_codon:yes stop_codon:yes gene_type:complete
MGIKYFYTFLLLIGPMFLESRPISYSGGSTLMLKSNAMQNSAYYHYSPSYKFSIGIEQVKDKYFDADYSYLRLTYLLNRKNTQHSQRNLYLQSGISSDGVDHYFYGVHGDWETRRLFSGFGYKETQTASLDYAEKYLQLGVAPYIGEYGDLHTWLMVKAKHDELTNEWNTYPVLKLFKGNALMEIGYTDASEWDIHFMYRF